MPTANDSVVIGLGRTKENCIVRTNLKRNEQVEMIVLYVGFSVEGEHYLYSEPIASASKGSIPMFLPEQHDRMETPMLVMKDYCCFLARRHDNLAGNVKRTMFVGCRLRMQRCIVSRPVRLFCELEICEGTTSGPLVGRLRLVYSSSFHIDKRPGQASTAIWPR